MDDDLILNLAVEADLPSSKVSSSKKGGRWTDRVKAKRVTKRKDRPDDHRFNGHVDTAEWPAKKARKDGQPPLGRSSVIENEVHTERSTAPKRPSTQIISSLFTSNPKIEQLAAAPLPRTVSKPSNAPLMDSSTFTGLGLDPLIVTHLQKKMEITKPTSIQRAALPPLLSDSGDGSTRRDVFIQSQTGSGKTLSFLLPIIQDLLPLSTHSYIDRSIGTLAVIIAPTRELAKQISDVLETLLTMRLRPADETPDDAAPGPRLTRWLVSGLLTGGSTKTHEKARLRKGIPILVSTPGRLLDHLQNTSSFNVGKCRWLVLDEADRLMELGFEETITGIIKGLDGRRKLAIHAVEEGKSMEVGGWDWDRRRRTILCSATIQEDVQKLAGTTLLNPIVIKATQVNELVKNDPSRPHADVIAEAAASNTKFTPPSQLAQKYVIVPLKLRLVTLVALLRSLLARTHGQRATKILVFLSCTDSVDFHWHLLGGTAMDDDEEAASSDSDSQSDATEDEETRDEKPRKASSGSSERVEVKSSLLPNTSIFRLHGSLPLRTRLASLRGFSSTRPGKSDEPSRQSSILLCTSVASRGLDLPLVRAVIQYDLPTEGGATEYVHRVGRTARVGKGGEAWSFVTPSEAEWAKWVEKKMQGDAADDKNKTVALESVSADSVLKSGFGGAGDEFEERATEVQLSFERWVLRDKQNAGFARKAYQSHIRAYATHPSDEKHLFHVRNLHLGHLAKSFALREAPSSVTSSSTKTKGKGVRTVASQKSSGSRIKRKAGKDQDVEDDYDVKDAERRMEQAVRVQGRLTKKSGKMARSGIAEFQIAGGYALEKLINNAQT